MFCRDYLGILEIENSLLRKTLDSRRRLANRSPPDSGLYKTQHFVDSANIWNFISFFKVQWKKCELLTYLRKFKMFILFVNLKNSKFSRYFLTLVVFCSEVFKTQHFSAFLNISRPVESAQESAVGEGGWFSLSLREIQLIDHLRIFICAEFNFAGFVKRFFRNFENRKFSYSRKNSIREAKW